MWNSCIDIQIVSSRHNFIDTTAVVKGHAFNCTFTYGAPNMRKRQEVWDSLAAISSSRPGPWFLTGDFNEMIENSEKSGGTDRSENSFVPFRSFLSQCDLFDVQHTGNFLSWRGKRETHVVHCRLDRSIANSEWTDLFPHSRSHYLRYEISDHRPLLTIFDPTKKKTRKMFRYDRRLRSNQQTKRLWKRLGMNTLALKLPPEYPNAA